MPRCGGAKVVPRVGGMCGITRYFMFVYSIGKGAMRPLLFMFPIRFLKHGEILNFRVTRPESYIDVLAHNLSSTLSNKLRLRVPRT
jgi:hypothetical protein